MLKLLLFCKILKQGCLFELKRMWQRQSKIICYYFFLHVDQNCFTMLQKSWSCFYCKATMKCGICIARSKRCAVLYKKISNCNYILVLTIYETSKAFAWNMTNKRMIIIMLVYVNVSLRKRSGRCKFKKNVSLGVT